MGCLTMPKGIPNKRYTPEFKKLVVETMQKENDYREGYGMMGRQSRQLAMIFIDIETLILAKPEHANGSRATSFKKLFDSDLDWNINI